MTQAQSHIPVMIKEVLAALSPVDGEVYVDGTFGAGGYSRAFLDAANCTVIAIDRDEDALARSKDISDRLIPAHGSFGDVDVLAHAAGYEKVDGFVMDLGVSSMQIDEPHRGFSFRSDGPLDMRMDQKSDIETAADVVNNYDEKDIANIIYRYGEERHSRKIAKEIINARTEKKIETTTELAEIVRRVVPRSRKDNIDPATRTFQALRIHVNRELEELEKALASAVHLLDAGGRLVVVSFHSLEDGIVKRFMHEYAGRKSKGSRHLPDVSDDSPAVFDLPHVKPLYPAEEEISSNPRSRSARMRVAVRTDSPAKEIKEVRG